MAALHRSLGGTLVFDEAPITRFQERHAKVCESLMMRAFRGAVLPHVPLSDWRAFVELVRGKALEKRSRRHTMMVALYGPSPVGFAEIKPGNHLMLLFVDTGWQGRGIGAALLREVEAYCRQLGSHVSVNASRNAIPFYDRMGYREKGGPLPRAGFAYQPMEKEISLAVHISCRRDLPKWH